MTGLVVLLRVLQTGQSMAEPVAQDDMSPEQDIWVFLLDLSRVPMEAIACCHGDTLL